MSEQRLLYKNKIISVPDTDVSDWSCLEVCAWLISIDDDNKFSNYIPSLIENNINGNVLPQMTFVNIMKLSNYQINVSDCNQLMMSIKALLKDRETYNPLKPPSNVVLSSTAETPRIYNTSPSKNKNKKNECIQAQDDINVPVFVEDNNSNQVVIAQGRFWRLFYFPKEQMIQYEVDKAVSKWTTYEVSLWIKVCSDGKFQNYAPYIIKHDIDGNHLLNITRNELKNDLKMISPNVRRLFFEELRALSSLEKCNIQKQRKSMDYQDIHRLSLRLAQHEMDAFINLSATTLSVDGNSSINDSRSRSRSPSPKSAVDDIEVAQKIVKGIHERTHSSSVVVADLS